MTASSRETRWSVCRLGLIASVIATGGLHGCVSSPMSKTPVVPVNYSRQIEPLVETHCYEYHGSALAVPSGKFRLDTRAHMLDGGRSGQSAIEHAGAPPARC